MTKDGIPEVGDYAEVVSGKQNGNIIAGQIVKVIAVRQKHVKIKKITPGGDLYEPEIYIWRLDFNSLTAYAWKIKQQNENQNK